MIDNKGESNGDSNVIHSKSFPALLLPLERKTIDFEIPDVLQQQAEKGYQEAKIWRNKLKDLEKKADDGVLKSGIIPNRYNYNDILGHLNTVSEQCIFNSFCSERAIYWKSFFEIIDEELHSLYARPVNNVLMAKDAILLDSKINDAYKMLGLVSFYYYLNENPKTFLPDVVFDSENIRSVLNKHRMSNLAFRLQEAFDENYEILISVAKINLKNAILEFKPSSTPKLVNLYRSLVTLDFNSADSSSPLFSGIVKNGTMYGVIAYRLNTNGDLDSKIDLAMLSKIEDYCNTEMTSHGLIGSNNALFLEINPNDSDFLTEEMCKSATSIDKIIGLG